MAELKNIQFMVQFFIASSAGYSMHESCMYCLKKYVNFLENKRE